jgi:hypothetical protein
VTLKAKYGRKELLLFDTALNFAAASLAVADISKSDDSQVVGL